tara:strand:- start:142 stop:558 length:417 start_codon:yes stop_codon:yes gene_type:complete
MGFFSWKTQDTNKSIANKHSKKHIFSVTMTDNKGNRWHEHKYEGYGEFGGKDFYELLAEMNGKTGRDSGISIAFSKKPHLQPNLTEDYEHEWVDKHPKDCPDQGFFYEEEWIEMLDFKEKKMYTYEELFGNRSNKFSD